MSKTEREKAVLYPPAIRWIVEPTYDDDGIQRSSGVDQYGREHPDPVPHTPPVTLGGGQVDPLYAQIRQMVQNELIRHAVEQSGFESFEEAEDFDVEDDNFPVDPHTPWEAVFDPPPAGGPPGGGTAEAAGNQPSASASPSGAIPSAVGNGTASPSASQAVPDGQSKPVEVPVSSSKGGRL